MNEKKEVYTILKDTEALLQDIECELRFLMPNSKKLIDVRNLVIWLKGGEPITGFKSELDAKSISSSNSLCNNSTDPFTEAPLPWDTDEKE